MDDLDDDLLALAEGTSSRKSKSSSKSKSKSSSSSSNKRKRPVEKEDSASDMDMSTDDDGDDDEPPARKARFAADSDDDEEDASQSRARADKSGAASSDDEGQEDDDEDPAKLFPLEGKYRDEEDKQRILSLTELEREAELGERLEKVAQLQERAQVRQMVRRKERRERGEESSDEEQASKKASRAKGPASKYDKLKKSRAERGKKKSKAREEEDYDDDDIKTRRRRSTSIDDYSDDSASDHDRPKRKAAAAKKGKKQAAADAVGANELRSIVVPRSKLAAFCAAPWFEQWVKGAWVRYLVGLDHTGQQSYRLCQVENVKDVPERPYRFEGVSTTLQLELRHGAALKSFTMEAVSESPFLESEFIRLARTCQVDKVDLPSPKEAQKVKNKLDQRKEYIMTEEDVTQLLAKKGPRVNPTTSKARLLIQRDFALQTNDTSLLEEINQSLAKFDAPPPSPAQSNTEQERMRRVNERNRATNREEIKKAEGRAQDERRKQAAALARGDSEVKIDPSARVKTLTRLKYDRDTPSVPGSIRPGAPAPGETTAVDQAISDSTRQKGSKFEEMVAAKVDVDIDLDF